MGLFFTKKFYCCLLVFASFTANAQTRFTETLSPSKAGRDEYITLTLSVENAQDVQKIQPPSLDDFTLVSGPEQQSGMSSVNGAVTRYIALVYVLLPKKPGTFSLGAGIAVIGGKTYKSNTATVAVSNKKTGGRQQNNNNNLFSLQMPLAGADPFEEPKREEQFDEYVLKRGESVPDKVNRNMQVRAETDKTSCYVGEPILATYKLYSRLKSESNLSKNPSFNGFSVIDMTDPDPIGGHGRESMNGREYNTYIIRKVQLYPLQAGELALETAMLDNKVDFIKYSNGNNYPGNIVTENVSLSSKPITISVKPLPEEGKPAGFKGAVGNFEIKSSLEKNIFSTDEAGRLLVTISGKGNMQLLTAPDIKWPADFETFDVKFIDNTDNKTIPLSGTKTFEIPFAVEKQGTYSTPAVSFSYFDPAMASYKTIAAPPVKFMIQKGNGKHKFNAAAPETKVSSSLLNDIFSHRLLVILFLAGIIIFAVIFWMGKEKGKAADIVAVKEDQSQQVAENILAQQNPLSKTEDCLLEEECPKFYSILNMEFREFLSQRFSIPPDMLTTKSLAAAMDNAAINNVTILQTQELLRDIEWQVYTPFIHGEKLHEMYSRTQTIVQMLSMRTA